MQKMKFSPKYFDFVVKSSNNEVLYNKPIK